MKKTLFGIVLIAGILLSSMAGAYPYYSNYYAPNNYDALSFHSSRTTARGGFVNTKDTFFDKQTSTQYLPNGGYEKRTTFTTTTRESPYRSTGRDYMPQYYDSGRYYDDSYWYMKNWDNRNVYSYNSYPRYYNRYGYNY